jgi:predicted  nucleic acid-binding Zn-ribbon protein
MEDAVIQSSRLYPPEETIMSDKRDEYVKKYKAQLDQWNAEIGKLEAQAKKVGAEVQARYEKELEDLNKRLEEGKETLKKIQSANEAALHDMMEGADTMWTAFEDAFRKARSRYR